MGVDSVTGALFCLSQKNEQNIINHYINCSQIFLYLGSLSGGILFSVDDVIWCNSSWVYTDSEHNNNEITLWKSSLH